MRGLMFFAFLLVAANAHAASALCGVAPVEIFESHFETGEVLPAAYVPNPTLPADGTPVALVVTYPTEGITVGTSSIQVYGTFTGPANTGVAVNDTGAKTNPCAPMAAAARRPTRLAWQQTVRRCAANATATVMAGSTNSDSPPKTAVAPTAAGG